MSESRAIEFTFKEMSAMLLEINVRIREYRAQILFPASSPDGKAMYQDAIDSLEGIKAKLERELRITPEGRPST